MYKIKSSYHHHHHNLLIFKFIVLLLLSFTTFHVIESSTSSSNNIMVSNIYEDRVIIVCATTGPGYWMMKNDESNNNNNKKDIDDETLLLKNMISKHGGEEWIYNPVLPWNLTGYYADTLSEFLQVTKLKVKVKFYNSYTLALYHTTKSKICDVAFIPLFHTASRTYCENYTSLSGILPCQYLNDDDDGNNKTSYNPSKIKSSHACCADFATPNEISNLAITVPIVPGTNDLASAFFTIGMVNVLSLLIFSVVIAAHIVWYFERNENEEQFPKFYLDGIDDAIWWSVTTVTTVGYGDKFPISSAGRIFGLVWMCFGLVIYAMFAVSILCCICIYTHPKSEKKSYL